MRHGFLRMNSNGTSQQLVSAMGLEENEEPAIMGSIVWLHMRCRSLATGGLCCCVSRREEKSQPLILESRFQPRVCGGQKAGVKILCS